MSEAVRGAVWFSLAMEVMLKEAKGARLAEELAEKWEAWSFKKLAEA